MYMYILLSAYLTLIAVCFVVRPVKNHSFCRALFCVTQYSVFSISVCVHRVLRYRPGIASDGTESYKEAAAGLSLPVVPGSIPVVRGFSDSSHRCESPTL